LSLAWIATRGGDDTYAAAIVPPPIAPPREETPAQAPRDVPPEPVKADEPEEIAMDGVRVARPARGLFSVDSRPYARIFVDGVAFGVTPVLKRSLPAGRHRLRAVLEDGRAKELQLDVPANAQAAPILLTW
ncbi:MAG: PEGA domain-containing protein, partial [Deltaproteobacteria bacterium]|nr:PEGA domain-containing protein [Deltaproteobacteria bacterium]